PAGPEPDAHLPGGLRIAARRRTRTADETGSTVAGTDPLGPPRRRLRTGPHTARGRRSASRLPAVRHGPLRARHSRPSDCALPSAALRHFGRSRTSTVGTPTRGRGRTAAGAVRLERDGGGLSTRPLRP